MKPRGQTKTLDDPKGEGFGPAVSNRLRFLESCLRGWEGEKRELNETSKTLLGSLDRENDGGKTAKSKRLLEDLGLVTRKLDYLKTCIKWGKDALMETIRHADEPGLFDDDENPTPPAELFVHKGGKDASSVGGEADDKE